MQSRRGTLSRLRNATSIALDKLEAHESARKHRVDVEIQAVNQALAMFRVTPRNTKCIPTQHRAAYFIRKLQM